MKKSKKKNKKIRIIIIVALVIILGICIYMYLNKKEKHQTVVTVVDKIDKYGYTLDDSQTELYKSLFYELKDVLNASNVDEEKYATLVAKLFAVDFYDLNSKTSKNNVGGLQFVYPDNKENLALKATNTIYDIVKSNLYGERNQELPIVKSVDAKQNEVTTFKYGDTTDNKAYDIIINLTYEKDLKYSEEISLILIHNDKRIDIAKISDNNEADE